MVPNELQNVWPCRPWGNQDNTTENTLREGWTSNTDEVFVEQWVEYKWNFLLFIVLNFIVFFFCIPNQFLKCLIITGNKIQQWSTIVSKLFHYGQKVQSFWTRCSNKKNHKSDCHIASFLFNFVNKPQLNQGCFFVNLKLAWSHL